MMEKSIFGSAIKTYPSKRNRFSSYRPSCLVFKDDDPFDQLIKEEETKKPLTVKKINMEKGVVRNTKSYLPLTHNVPVLKNIQNYSCINRKTSFLPRTKKKKTRTKISKRNKENTLKCSSRLFKSNSDSDNDLPGLSVYNLSPTINPLADYKKRKAFQRSRPKQKSFQTSSTKDINENSCVLNKESETSKPEAVNISYSNISFECRNPTPVQPNETVFKKPTVFVERSSDLFYKNSLNKNHGQTKTRKKLSFFVQNYSCDNVYDADGSFENVDEGISRISHVGRKTIQSRISPFIVDELFNSDGESQNDYRCSVVFNPNTASTPNFDRKKLQVDEMCNKNDTKHQKCARSYNDNPASFSLHVDQRSNKSGNSISFQCSQVSINEASDQNIHSDINKLQDVSEDDHIEKVAQLLDYSSDSYAGSSSSENDSLSSALISDSEKEQSKLKTVSTNNSLMKIHNSATSISIPISATHSENLNCLEDASLNSDVPIQLHLENCAVNRSESDISSQVDEPNLPPSIISSLSSSSNDCSEVTLFKMFEENFEMIENDISRLTNQLQSCSLENEPSINVDEPISETNCSSSSVSTKELICNSFMINLTPTKEISTCLVNELTNNISAMNVAEEQETKELSFSEISKCLSPIHVPSENFSENTTFEGWSGEEYFQAIELKEAFEEVCKQIESEYQPREEEIPAHLKHVTRRRKKTFVMPTLDEENSNLEIDQVDLSSNNPRNSPFPNKNLQISSQNQTSLFTSRFLERSSMMNHSIVLAAGKKWRRSFITLKNIREYGFQSQTNREELKGRCWRKNVEELISNQLDENSSLKEIGESSTLRTGSNETFLNSNYTYLEQCKKPEKARFSLCVNQKAPPPQQQQQPVDESSGLTTSSDTSKVYDDKSYISFVGSQQNSRIESNYDLEAGDYSRSYKVSLDCYDIRDHLSAKETVLRYCKQTEPLPFDECFNNRLLQNCKKIGEGVYGEVFMLKRNRAHCSVLKIIPIEGDLLVNGERQKKFEEIVSELVISIELSDLRKRKDYFTDNFAELQKCWCVYGKYPKRLIDLWDDYNDVKGSDNDSPKVFDDNQLYVILELSHGGEDVESFVFNNALQALSVFTQVTYALAVAEEAFNFEHRDLHWGNILVCKSKQEKVKYRIGDSETTVRLRGVKVTIIDYTLSRISINNCVVFNDIGQDPDLFTAHGDFQFEVYRLMREEVRNIWNQFMPKTNVYWLCYLLDKMLKEVRYRRIHTQIHRTNFKRLEEFYESILGFASCNEFICDSYFKRIISATK